MVKVCPAMVSVPLRGLELVFAFTEKLTNPCPLPLAPEVICAQPTLLEALQLPHPAEGVTSTLPVPPAAPKEALVWDRVNVQAGGGAPPDGGIIATAKG